MQWLWYVLAFLIVTFIAIARAHVKRPTVAEVHSWADGEDYRMLLVLNGTDTILRAGLTLPDDRPATAKEAAAAMLRVLGKRVRFTPRTVYIPEGPLGLNAAP